MLAWFLEEIKRVREEKMGKAKTVYVVVLCIMALVLLAMPITYTALQLFGTITRPTDHQDAIVLGGGLWIVGAIGCYNALLTAHNILFSKNTKK